MNLQLPHKIYNSIITTLLYYSNIFNYLLSLTTNYKKLHRNQTQSLFLELNKYLNKYYENKRDFDYN